MIMWVAQGESAMGLNNGTDWGKTIGLIVGAVFVLWFLWMGFRLVRRFAGSY